MTDQLDEFGRIYAEVRQRLIDTPPAPMGRLTDAQRAVVAHDGVPCRPDPRMWTAEEYAEKLAEYNRRIGYKISPLGNYVYTGPRSTDPQDLPLPYMSREEIRQSPEYGILRRILEQKGKKS